MEWPIVLVVLVYFAPLWASALGAFSGYKAVARSGFWVWLALAMLALAALTLWWGDAYIAKNTNPMDLGGVAIMGIGLFGFIGAFVGAVAGLIRWMPRRKS